MVGTIRCASAMSCHAVMCRTRDVHTSMHARTCMHVRTHTRTHARTHGTARDLGCDGRAGRPRCAGLACSRHARPTSSAAGLYAKKKRQRLLNVTWRATSRTAASFFQSAGLGCQWVFGELGSFAARFFFTRPALFIYMCFLFSKKNNGLL